MLVQLHQNSAGLRNEGVYEDFVSLVVTTIKVELAKIDELDPDDRMFFISGDDGVAQWRPLSAPADEVALAELDQAMNDPARGVPPLAAKREPPSRQTGSRSPPLDQADPTPGHPDPLPSSI